MKPEFKATKESLLALVESANNTNGSGDFVEAGEPMDLSEHPLKNEVMQKIKNGEIVFS